MDNPDNERVVLAHAVRSGEQWHRWHMARFQHMGAGFPQWHIAGDTQTLTSVKKWVDLPSVTP